MHTAGADRFCESVLVFGSGSFWWTADLAISEPIPPSSTYTKIFHPRTDKTNTFYPFARPWPTGQTMASYGPLRDSRFKKKIPRIVDMQIKDLEASAFWSHHQRSKWGEQENGPHSHHPTSDWCFMVYLRVPRSVLRRKPRGIESAFRLYLSPLVLRVLFPEVLIRRSCVVNMRCLLSSLVLSVQKVWVPKRTDWSTSRENRPRFFPDVRPLTSMHSVAPLFVSHFKWVPQSFHPCKLWIQEEKMEWHDLVWTPLKSNYRPNSNAHKLTLVVNNSRVPGGAQ